MFNQPGYFLRAGFLAGALASFGSFGVTNASITAHATLFTKNVTKRIPEADAAKWADDVLKSVKSPAIANPNTANIRYAYCSFRRWFFSLFHNVRIDFVNSNMFI